MTHVRSNPPDLSPPLGLTCAQFVARCVDEGTLSPDRAAAAYSGFFRQGTWHLSPASTSPPVPIPSNVLRSESPEGEVIKFLLTVPGVPGFPGGPGTGTGAERALDTESVIIPMKRRHETTFTLCVSSQVGCAMGCTFCETAQMGLIRSLDTAEIVQQVWAARHHLGAAIRNVVFMGMGEPLDNLDNVVRAIEVLTDNRGPAIAMSRITVSTVGRLDGLARLREHVQRPGWKQLNLAVSVNAPNDDIRSRIMPINRSMPLGELIPVLETWPRRKSGAICVEYVLIPGVNDAPEHAEELAARLRSVRCCVNVIPYNPRRNSPWPAPDEQTVAAFLQKLESLGQFCKRRRTKGRDTMAACGQLGNQSIRRRRFVELSTPVATA